MMTASYELFPLSHIERAKEKKEAHAKRPFVLPISEFWRLGPMNGPKIPRFQLVCGGRKGNIGDKETHDTFLMSSFATLLSRPQMVRACS